MPSKLFEGKDLTEGETEFVKNVLEDIYTSELGTLQMLRAQTLATLRLAKEIEKSTLSVNKSASAMVWLTRGLVFVGVCQIIVGIINMSHR